MEGLGVASELLVYVASPLGFSAAGRLWNSSVLIPVLLEAGLQPLDPWSKPGSGAGTSVAGYSTEENARLAAENEAMIRRAAGLLAVLDGADVDSGTAAEIGFASALGKRIVGLRTDFRTISDNRAARVNLQIEYWIRAGGGSVHTDPALAAEEMARLLG
jgi:nucleoside 2-deoxyribosyltransferase